MTPRAAFRSDAPRLLVSLLGIRHIIVEVNKMDRVNNDEVFRRIHDECLQIRASRYGRSHRPGVGPEGRNV